MSELSKNGLGAEINLTNNTKYICPSDGYFTIFCDYMNKSYTRGYVEGKNVMTLSSTSGEASVNFVSNTYSSIFVKRGMEIFFIGVSTSKGYFYPFE